MPDDASVRTDHGEVNRRILARQSSADYRRIEQASIKQRTNLCSPEAKRLFARFFHTLQINAHFVCDIARLHLSADDVERVEDALRQRLDRLAAALSDAIEGAAALYAANGIIATATYDTVPLEVEVGIISSFGRRYLEALHLFDRLMPILRTLEIYEVISSRQVDTQRKIHRKAVRGAAVSARELATGMRRRINELSPTPSRSAGNSSLAEPPAESRTTGPSASSTSGQL